MFYKTGVRKGIKKGREEGREEESKRSKVKIRKEKLKTAINLKKKAFEIDFILSIVDLEKTYLEKFFRKIKS